MKIDRDNFRHLTGFGRDVLEHVQMALADITKKISPPPSTGHIHIVYNADEGRSEYALMPLESESFDQRVCGSLRVFHIKDGIQNVIAVPLFLLLENRAPQYHLYRHVFLTDQNGDRIENQAYIGITSRGWRKRWAEHMYSAKTGSNYLFHKAIRKHHGVAKCELHSVVGWASSEKQAFELEERLVEKSSLYPLGLNMVPGGNAGLAYLRKIGAIGANERVGVDGKHDIINRFFDYTSRKGLPNPLAAANWLNADYAEKVICAGPDRLKPQQIRDARFFASLGQNADDIAAKVGARNVTQIERLVSGQTYSRIL